MGQFLLLLVIALTVGAIVFGITVLLTGEDSGLGAVEPDGRAVPLPANRPLVEQDVEGVRFDTTLRGYRMSQVDAALRRAAYDIGYKEELINVLEAEVAALRSGRFPDAEVLRRARDAAVAPLVPAAGSGIEIIAGDGTGDTAGDTATIDDAGARVDPVEPQPVPPGRAAEPADRGVADDSPVSTGSAGDDPADADASGRDPSSDEMSSGEPEGSDHAAGGDGETEPTGAADEIDPIGVAVPEEPQAVAGGKGRP